MKKLGLVLFSVMAGGCATQKYGFRPVGPVATAEAGFPASHYAVPPESPRGEVFVTSFGTREIDAGGGARTQLIHVRMAVANHNGEAAWNVDPGQQLVVPPGGAPQHPDFLEIDGRNGGPTTVERGQKRVLDLYYRLPPGVSDTSKLPGFELQWQVNVGTKIVADRTPFTSEPYRDYDETSRTQVAVGVGVAAPWWAYGWGPGWWGGFGWYGPWGYPYYGPYVGLGLGWGYPYRPYRYYGGGRYGGGYGGGGYSRGGGGGYGRSGGTIRAPTVRGRGR